MFYPGAMPRALAAPVPSLPAAPGPAARRVATVAALAGLGALGVLLAPAGRASSTAPQPGLTGVPAAEGVAAEGDCTLCHTGAPRNPDDAAQLRLRGLPERYEPGRAYPLVFEVRHDDPSRRRWGFQLTAVDRARLRGAGRLEPGDPARTGRLEGRARRQYLVHAPRGTGVGEAGGQAWRFTWVAPERDAGAVAFFAVVNAANVDGSNQGDRIYGPAPEPLAVVAGPADAPEGGAEGPSQEARRP